VYRDETQHNKQQNNKMTFQKKTKQIVAAVTALSFDVTKPTVRGAVCVVIKLDV